MTQEIKRQKENFWSVSTFRSLYVIHTGFTSSDPKLSALDKEGMYSAITESCLDKHRKCKNESFTPEYIILYNCMYKLN